MASGARRAEADGRFLRRLVYRPRVGQKALIPISSADRRSANTSAAPRGIGLGIPTPRGGGRTLRPLVITANLEFCERHDCWQIARGEFKRKIASIRRRLCSASTVRSPGVPPRSAKRYSPATSAEDR
jgi:hypothetical protein